jgi:hypothetical protein
MLWYRFGTNYCFSHLKQPQNNLKVGIDRNRAKALLGEEAYEKVAHKFVDFQTLVVNRVISTNLDEAGKGYVQDRKLWTIYKYFFSDDDKSPVPLMEASESWASTGDKC